MLLTMLRYNNSQAAVRFIHGRDQDTAAGAQDKVPNHQLSEDVRIADNEEVLVGQGVRDWVHGCMCVSARAVDTLYSI